GRWLCLLRWTWYIFFLCGHTDLPVYAVERRIHHGGNDDPTLGPGANLVKVCGLTPGVSRCRKRKRGTSVRWRQSAGRPALGATPSPVRPRQAPPSRDRQGIGGKMLRLFMPRALRAERRRGCSCETASE